MACAPPTELNRAVAVERERIPFFSSNRTAGEKMGVFGSPGEEMGVFGSPFSYGKNKRHHFFPYGKKKRHHFFQRGSRRP
jgi:hypothetical protein